MCAILFALLTAPSCTDADRNVVAPAPLTLPDRIQSATLSFDSLSGSAVLSWRAPRPSIYGDGVTTYTIHYSYSDVFEWDLARAVPDPPRPGPPGAIETYAFARPRRGFALAASVASVDNAGRAARPGRVARLAIPGWGLFGRLKSPLDNGRVASLSVEAVYSSDTTRVASGPGGDYRFSDVRSGDYRVLLRDTQRPPERFDLRLDVAMDRDRRIDLVVLPYGRSSVSTGYSLLQVLQLAVGAPSNWVAHRWATLPIRIQIDPFTNADSVDYAACAVAAAAEWESATGLSLFRWVALPPDTGVTIRPRPPAEMGIQNGFTEHTNAADGSPVRSGVSVLDTFADPTALRIVMLHELGHALRLSHLPSGFLMYAGRPLPNQITADEATIVEWLYTLANGSDLRRYVEPGS